MLVLITGGIGFLGSHAVSAVARAGHRIRLLARERSSVGRPLAELGVDPRSVDLIVGDVRDPHVVARAVDGCDAVIHTAGRSTFDSRAGRGVRDVNVRAVQTIHEACLHANTPRIVHLSSLSALSTLGRRPANGFQVESDRVTIVYAAAPLGPNDPHLGKELTRLRDTLRTRVPVWPRGGMSLSDVRDVARLLAAAVEPDFPDRHHIAPAAFLSTQEYVEILRVVTGRRLPAVWIPALPWHIPQKYGAVNAARTGFAAQSRTIVETVADSVRWLYERGHLRARQAGRAIQVPVPDYAHDPVPVG